MRSIDFFINRFEFALKNSKSQKNGSFGIIHINQNDVKNLLELIRFRKENYNSQLEDSLLLFWIFSYWKIEIENQKPTLSADPKQSLRLTDGINILDKLCALIRPKDEIIKDITTNLQSAQMKHNTPLEKLISETDVSVMLEDLLEKVKRDFIPISDLKKHWKVNYTFPELSEGQKHFLNQYRLTKIKT